MFRILKLVLLAASANCAPATFTPMGTTIGQPYFLFGPQPQIQFQYEPLLKIQSPAAETSAKIELPKNQYVYLYPNVPQYPLLALRQSEGGTTDYWVQINNWWNQISEGLNQNPAPVTQPAAPITAPVPAPESSTRSKMDPMQPLLPASTMPLVMNKQRFYLINSLPQFYGNFAALPAIGSPILAIDPLQARSPVDSIPAENEKVEQFLPEDVEVAQQPAVVQPITPLQLRSNIMEPVQRLEISQPQIPMADNGPLPQVAAQQLARFLQEARSQDAGPNMANTLNEEDANKLRSEENPLEEEASIAQAKPSGIALSGKGGVSSSAPSATAIVGDGGLAIASPSAISLSGDFEDEELKMKEKAAEPIGSPCGEGLNF